MDNNSKHKPSRLPIIFNSIFLLLLMMDIAIYTEMFYIRLIIYVAYMIAGLIAVCMYIFEAVKYKKEPNCGKIAFVYILMGIGVFILIMTSNICNVSRLW